MCGSEFFFNSSPRARILRALAVYGVNADWRNHIGAAAVLFSTALVVALVDRYLWELYFEKKRQTRFPTFCARCSRCVLLVALLLILSLVIMPTRT